MRGTAATLEAFLALEIKPEVNYILAVDSNIIGEPELAGLFEAMDELSVPPDANDPGTFLILRIPVPSHKTLADCVALLPIEKKQS